MIDLYLQSGNAWKYQPMSVMQQDSLFGSENEYRLH